MDIIIYVFAALAFVGITLATLAIWAPRPTLIRFAALGVAILFLPIAYVQSLELLSRPKPASYEWFERESATAEVLSVSFDEGKQIFLWLRVAGEKEPRSYVVPWNLKLAEKLEDAVDDAVRRNSTILLKDPFFRRSFEEWGNLNVEIVPPPLPPQKRPQLPPQVHNPRNKESI